MLNLHFVIWITAMVSQSLIFISFECRLYIQIILIWGAYASSTVSTIVYNGFKVAFTFYIDPSWALWVKRGTTDWIPSLWSHWNMLERERERERERESERERERSSYINWRCFIPFVSRCAGVWQHIQLDPIKGVVLHRQGPDTRHTMLWARGGGARGIWTP